MKVGPKVVVNVMLTIILTCQDNLASLVEDQLTVYVISI